MWYITLNNMYAILFCLCFLYVHGDNQPNKRILITDTNYVRDQEIETLKAMVQSLQTKVTQLETHPSNGGSVYVRWGHHNCSNTAELIYSGTAGGSMYNQAGGSADYVCLPRDPQWAKYNDAASSDGAFMYGAEYEHNFFASTSRINSDVPCAVCRSPRTANIMIPARTQCYKNWTVEYTGYLAGGNYNSASANNFVCVDDEVGTVFHSQANENGKLFYQVEGICGSLSCPPYVNYRELTCVVCTN